ncbi:MAG: dephospho-CoA kinase [Lachnospiraceae bacterium]|jgi:dephospho-CoA kinase|nr:dephospho-CoA kinase [Lachnospiraceae bacterium]
MEKWILGITGGVGCGKSTVLQILEQEYHAQVIQADLVAHELMRPGQECYQKITAAFGTEILTSEGFIDRKHLGQLIFSDEEKRLLLNSLTHPAVKQEIRRRTGEDRRPFSVIEAALLWEDRYDEICDEIWYIYASRDVRFQRLADSRGYTKERTRAIMNSQMGEEELRQRCHAVIDNSGTLQETENTLRQLLRDRAGIRPSAAGSRHL